MTDIKLIALGGVREYGKNFYLVEINDSMFILMLGLNTQKMNNLGLI